MVRADLNDLGRLLSSQFGILEQPPTEPTEGVGILTDVGSATRTVHDVSTAAPLSCGTAVGLNKLTNIPVP